MTNGNPAIARLLIDHGATVHSVDRNGGTVLHAASRHGRLGVVRLLLRHGADVNMLNKANQTAVAVQPSWHQRMAKAKLQSSFPEYKADANI